VTEWVPASVRLMGASVPAPYDGVPNHLWPLLRHWLIAAYATQDEPALRRIALKLRVPLSDSDLHSAHLLFTEDRPLSRALIDGCYGAATRLDAVDYALRSFDEWVADPWEEAQLSTDLARLLQDSGSAYAIGPDGRSLVVRTDPTAHAAAAAAVAAADPAAHELAQAWVSAFGRNPNAEQAWRHAIRAVEELLVPIIEPRNTKATLGSALASLKRSPERWNIEHPNITVNTLTVLLGSVWPDPKRHGGDPTQQPATDKDAAAAVYAAVTATSWLRDGLLKRA